MDLILPIIFTIAPIDGSSYRVIDSPILQQFLSDVSQCLSHNAENIIVELRQQNTIK